MSNIQIDETVTRVVTPKQFINISKKYKIIRTKVIPPRLGNKSDFGKTLIKYRTNF